jgi:hypothetical protein
LTDAVDENVREGGTTSRDSEDRRDRGKTVHGEVANAGHRVLAPDDAEVEAYLEVALDAPAPQRTPEDERPTRSAIGATISSPPSPPSPNAYCASAARKLFNIPL